MPGSVIKPGDSHNICWNEREVAAREKEEVIAHRELPI
jgi:hypothetical protein